jgi:hypothetical protein
MSDSGGKISAAMIHEKTLGKLVTLSLLGDKFYGSVLEEGDV